MKFFKIVLCARTTERSQADPDFRLELGVIPAESLESAEQCLGFQNGSLAPAEFTIKVPNSDVGCGPPYERWRQEPIMLLEELPCINNREQLKRVVFPKD